MKLEHQIKLWVSVKIRPFRYGNFSLIPFRNKPYVELKSDRFGMEIHIPTSILYFLFLLLLKSDRFGMEIMILSPAMAKTITLIVKIRPFRYGNANILTLCGVKLAIFS